MNEEIRKFILVLKGKLIRCLIGRTNYEGLCYVVQEYAIDLTVQRYNSQDREGQVSAKEDIEWVDGLDYLFTEETIKTRKIELIKKIGNTFKK